MHYWLSGMSLSEDNIYTGVSILFSLFLLLADKQDPTYFMTITKIHALIIPDSVHIIQVSSSVNWPVSGYYFQHIDLIVSFAGFIYHTQSYDTHMYVYISASRDKLGALHCSHATIQICLLRLAKLE